MPDAAAPTEPATPAPSKERVPRPVYLLGLSIFVLGTTEFMLAGLLPTISRDMGVSIPDAGLLISGFAIGMTLGAPTMAVATLRLPRKLTLLGALAVFVAGHVVGALAPSYSVLMVTRVVSAVATGAFWAVASVVAVRLAPVGSTARALAVLVGGLTLSNVLGVPAGTWVGQELGWRAAFWAVAALAALAAVGVMAVIPRTQGGDVPSVRVRDELRVFRGRRIWLALATTASFQAAVFAAFSYFAPLLTDVAGVPEDSVPFVLALFGVGTFVGITIGGRVADRGLFTNIFGSLIALATALVVLAVVSGHPVAAVVAIVAVGLTGFSIAPGLNARVFVVAGDAPTLAASVNTSAFNVGNTVGPWAGGAVISAGWGYVAPVWVAVALTGTALALATAAWRHEHSHDHRHLPAT
ncbi:DHA1 family chloramphenicol resistance protein-like MFS transporter [Haloactinopolyspora alba]|uniref:DHA1 family chloramphenicol resistance protein-like MFS transporter n=1 Tax=Haloactinopolyspora alba TaxID=648780 RepID=A0A2P8DZX1_9ACTN|nr:Cmx/CmrA family chloramphenicol efflux MFS transporter [Haloactinopolyspora alba]PSL02773.1 DHA1 family chloramphenicol resistance protein-like MFS transporter [Haloactinopolyspora alba]